MKKAILMSLMVAAFAIISCNKYDVPDDTPDCIQTKIKEFNRNRICDDPVVTKYLYQNENVYLFDHGTCGADLTSEVIDEDCNSLGFLGGIAGNTVINGDTFYTKAIFIQVIWER